MESGDDDDRERGKREKRGQEEWEGERKDTLREEGRRPIKISEKGKERETQEKE